MKRLHLIIITTLTLINIGKSQTLNVPDNIGTSNNAGKVGIGTTNPQELLTIKAKSENSSFFRANSFATDLRAFEIGFTGTQANYISFKRRYNDVSYDFMTIQRSNGNVGIGISSPAKALHIMKSGGGTKDVQLRLGTYGNLHWDIGRSQSGGHFRILDNTGNIRFDIHPTNGNVGIGTVETGTHKLAVEGTIGAREIKVEATGWSDFVFNKDYKLKNLEEVENFIEENNHLPDIPSEKEVLENGIQVGEMNARLLQKIEELTLYMIEMNKEVKALKDENAELKEKVTKLETVE